jgi:hypothetical protein
VAAQGAARAAGEASPPLGAGNDAAPAAPAARGGRGGRGNNAAARGGQGDDDAAAAPARGGGANIDAGELTALVYAARSGDIESSRILLKAGADVNQTTG